MNVPERASRERKGERKVEKKREKEREKTEEEEREKGVFNYYLYFKDLANRA